MKLSLILCSFLLAPLVLAIGEAKEVKTYMTVSGVIFKDGHFIIRSANSYVSYTYSNPALVFNFDQEQSITLQNETVDFRKEGLSFALDNTKTWDGKLAFDSISDSDPELRHLISGYQGGIRIRKLRSWDEEKEIDAFIKTPEGASKSFQLSYNGVALTAKSVGLEQVIIHPSRLYFIVNYSDGKKSGSATIKDYRMKQFNVERTEKQVDCKNTPVKDLLVAYCSGNIQVVEFKKN